MALYIPEYLQTQKYSALRMRQVLLEQAVQNGALGATDFKVSQRGAGATMSVDVAAGAAFVRGTTVARQGLYHAYNDAVVNLPIAANASGNPRIDQVVLRIYDSIDGAAGSDQATLEVLTGTPSAGAQISAPAGASYRAGVATVPDSCLIIGDVAVASGAGSIVNANINDRRPWARGFYNAKFGNASANQSTTSTTFVAIDDTQFLVTGEFTGVPIEVEFNCTVSSSAVGAAGVPNIAANVDGGGVSLQRRAYSATAGAEVAMHLAGIIPTTLTGRHTIGMTWAVSPGAGTLTLVNNSAVRPHFIVREVVRQNSGN